MTKTRNNTINWRIRLLMIKFWCMRIAHKAIKPAIIAVLAVITILNTEIDYGVCLNAQGDGKLYNGEPYYNYICYASTDAQAGDKVLTVFFKNPTNLEPDDYIYRHDFIVTR